MTSKQGGVCRCARRTRPASGESNEDEESARRSPATRAGWRNWSGDRRARARWSSSSRCRRGKRSARRRTGGNCANAATAERPVRQRAAAAGGNGRDGGHSCKGKTVLGAFAGCVPAACQRTEPEVTPGAPMPRPVTPFVGCDVFVTDAQSRVLLVRRQDNGFWALPGGCQDLGETPARSPNVQFAANAARKRASRSFHHERSARVSSVRGVTSRAGVNYPRGRTTSSRTCSSRLKSPDQAIS